MQISISKNPNNIFAKFTKRENCQCHDHHLQYLADENQVRCGLRQKLLNYLASIIMELKQGGRRLRGRRL